MHLNEAEVLLTVNCRGRQALRGRYEAVAKTDEKGNVITYPYKEPNGRKVNLTAYEVKTVSHPKYHNCSYSTTLNNQFVRYAISMESRPEKYGVKFWANMSPSQRLKFHVMKYAKEMLPKGELSWQILN